MLIEEIGPPARFFTDFTLKNGAWKDEKGLLDRLKKPKSNSPFYTKWVKNGLN
jgi:hypothetical protein